MGRLFFFLPFSPGFECCADPRALIDRPRLRISACTTWRRRGRVRTVAARRAMLDHLYVLYTEVSEYVSTDGGSLDLPLAPREALA